TKVPGVTDIWLPASTLPALVHVPGILTDGGAQVWTTLVARRKAGVATKRIADDMNTAIPLIAQSGRPYSFMGPMTFHGYDGIGLPVSQRAGVARTLRIVGIAALALLLLTCANVANLGLTRSTSTSNATAVRRALGASASRVVRERLLESLLLGVAGAGLGVGLSVMALRFLRRTAITSTGISLEGIHLQQWVVIASVATALAAALLAGVVPAFLALRTRGSILLHAARSGTVRSYRIRSALVVAQVALSIVLVVWSGLLARTTWNLRHIDFGFDTQNVVQFSVDPELQGYDAARTTTFLRNLVAELQKQPAIRSAAIMDHGVFDPFTFAASIGVDPSLPDAAKRERVYTRRVQMSPALLDVLGLPLVAGRVFTADWLNRDTSATAVGMLNEAALKNYLPGVLPERAIGRTILLHDRTDIPVTITGIVKDARISDLEGRQPLMFFQPWSQGWVTGQFTVFVKGRDSNARVTAAIHDVVQSLDPALPVYGLSTLAERVDDQIAEQRFVANLAVALAVTGIILSMLGLYGTLSYMVLERTREIGVRAALGARPAALISRVVENGLALAAIGVVIGICAAVYLSHFIAARLYGITPFDGTTYLAGVMFVFTVAAAASAVPAKRAAGIDPMSALRHD
ncbi:MAG TPA: FtsX-like permease family protein, partial [Longimicrobiales bacterium]